MDPLTQTITLLRPRALHWKRREAAGDWAVRFPANNGAVFCLVAGGRCVFQVSEHQPRALGEGDFLLLTIPPVWTLGATESSLSRPVDGIDAASAVPAAAEGSAETAAVTQVFGGHFKFDDANAGLLDGLLPPIVEIRSAEAGAARLRGVLDLIGDEASTDRPGRTLVLDRLLEIMLVEAIRHCATGPIEPRRGLLAGLADPRIAASLRALHADIRRSWTVARLAAIAGMSRSVFAERFTRIVGVPPIDYLLRWRMALAKDALRFGDDRLAEVAFTCGYRSVSAFSAAFSRTVGCPPSRYATRIIDGQRISTAG